MTEKRARKSLEWAADIGAKMEEKIKENKQNMNFKRRLGTLKTTLHDKQKPFKMEITKFSCYS